jgi:hypothetical protein
MRAALLPVRLSTLASFVLAVTCAHDAGAVDKRECAGAYEEAQKLRASGALRASREKLLVCSDPTCPSVTQADCLTWIDEVDRQMPTLLLVVLDESGQDATAVDVTMDGKPLATTLDGKALPVDPGPHDLVFTLKDGASVRRSIVVREGEKGRRVEVSFVPEKAAPPPPEPELGPAIHPATWVLGGVGIAGIGLFGVMAGLGLAETSDAESTCAPRCSEDVVSSIETKFLVGDVGLGVGIASLSAAIVVGVVTGTSGAAPGSSAARLQLLGGPVQGGAMLGVSGTFER